MLDIRTALKMIAVTTAFLSCSRQPEQPISPEISKGDSTEVVPDTLSEVPRNSADIDTINFENYNKYATLSEFKSHGTVLNESAAGDIIANGKLGNLPTNAMVPVIVDSQNKLIDASTLNRGLLSENEIQIFFTDLKTFRSATQHPAADAQYTKYMISDGGRIVWIFDPYQSTYKTQKEVFTIIKETYFKSRKALRTTGDYLLTPGDIIVYPDFVNSHLDNIEQIAFDVMVDESIKFLISLGTQTPEALNVLNNIQKEYFDRYVEGSLSNSPTGHVAGIPFNSQHWTLKSLFDKTLTAEAQGYSDVDTDSEVEIRLLKEGWWDRRKHMFRLVPKAKSLPGNYWDPMQFWSFHCWASNVRYNLFSSKSYQRRIPVDNTHAPYKRFYCSLFVWQAYKDLAKADLDGDGGWYVFPNDLLLNSDNYWIIQTYNE